MYTYIYKYTSVEESVSQISGDKEVGEGLWAVMLMTYHFGVIY